MIAISAPLPGQEQKFPPEALAEGRIVQPGAETFAPGYAVLPSANASGRIDNLLQKLLSLTFSIITINFSISVYQQGLID